MTIGSDQLDAWGRTLTEVDELYREVQLLVRINPEAYTVDSDALATVGVANPEADDDGGLLHPLVFAKRWAWHLASEARAIPPITSAWVPLIRYVDAHLQYLSADDRETFAGDLRRVRGLLGALVNEHGLSQGEADALSKANGTSARRALRNWALTSDRLMKRKDLSKAFPTLTDREWGMLRKRKERSNDDIPAYHYPVRWAAEIAPEDDLHIPRAAPEEPYRDAMSRGVVSLESLDEELNYLDRETQTLILATKGKRQTQEDPDNL